MLVQGQRVDVTAYLERIGHEGGGSADLALLENLHRRHLASIPFENIDVRLGREIALDLESLQEKLVRRRRGGYCFEQNTLAAAVLRQLGFDVATLEARVRPPGRTDPLPRTHMTLSVVVDGAAWLFDVGFGGDGPLLPVPMDGRVSEQRDGDYRVEPESDHVRVLRRRSDQGWTDLYAFSLTPALPVDFEVANHFTATHRDSIFRQTLTVQRSLPDERRIFRGGVYVVRREGGETRREVEVDELDELLAEAFDIALTTAELDSLRALTPMPTESRPR